MNTILVVVLLIASFFIDDDCHHSCGSYNRNPNLAWMIVIPIVLVCAFLLYGYHSTYTEAPPKRVFISDVDGSKDSAAVAKVAPAAHKTAVKASSAAHKVAAKTHASEHKIAHHAN